MATRRIDQHAAETLYHHMIAALKEEDPTARVEGDGVSVEETPFSTIIADPADESDFEAQTRLTKRAIAVLAAHGLQPDAPAPEPMSGAMSVVAETPWGFEAKVYFWEPPAEGEEAYDPVGIEVSFEDDSDYREGD